MPRSSLIAIATAFLLCLACLTVAALTLHGNPIVSERTVGNLTMKAAPPAVKVGEMIRLGLTVSGPTEYGPAEYNTCRPVWFWAEDASGKRVWTEVQFWACASNSQTETIPAGKKLTFSVDWMTNGMAPGRYTVRGNFGVAQPRQGGNIPPVTIEIRR
jgi:hypothetical protein